MKSSPFAVNKHLEICSGEAAEAKQPETLVSNLDLWNLAPWCRPDFLKMKGDTKG